MHLPRALGALPLAGYAIAQEQILTEPTIDCPIPDAVFPLDFDISESPVWQNATSSFPAVIDELFSSGHVARNNASFVVDFFSTLTGKSVYTYTHVAPEILNGTQNVTMTKGRLDGDSIFRIGSVSKLFTVYAILVNGGWGVFDQSVTYWLPELGGNSRQESLEKIVWEDVTVGALMSHQSGAGGFSNQDLEATEAWVCLDKPQQECNQNFLDWMKNKQTPVQAINSVALYADSGYGILARVLERMTGLPFGEALTELVRKPLGLNSTSTFAPTGDFNGFIVNEEPVAWAFDNQISAGSGGIYSTSNDLARLGTAILNSTLLSPPSTARWLKPLAHTASLTSSVGAPWEIFRAPLPVSQGSHRTRVADIYTKGGGQPGYGTVFGLSPEHKLGFSIWIAGAGQQPLTERWPLRGVVLDHFLPAAEAAAWEFAKNATEGVFVAEPLVGGNATEEVPVNVTLTIDADRPGVGLTKLVHRNGTDTLAGMSTRVYPTGLEVSGSLSGVNRSVISAGNATGSLVRSYRSISDPVVMPEWRHRAAAEGGSGLIDTICDVWLSVGFSSADEVRMEFREGRVEAVFLGSLGMVFRRAE